MTPRSKPPTGRPRAFSSGNSRAVRSPLPRSRFASEDEVYDEDELCYEAYVSQSSRSNARDHPVTETARESNCSMSPSRDILEKLKNDLNSLDLMKNSLDDIENRPPDGARASGGFEYTKQNHRHISFNPRSMSVGRSRSVDFDRGESFSSMRKSLRLERSWSNEKSERAEDLICVETVMKKVRILEEEILKVTKDAEKDKQQMAEKLVVATERHDSELRSLNEKLRSAEAIEKALQEKINSLEHAIDGDRDLELLLQESKGENTKLHEVIYLLDSEIDSTKQDKGEISRALERALEEKQQISLQLRDSEMAHANVLQENCAIKKLLEEARDECNKAKRALEDALVQKQRFSSKLSDAESAHSQTKKATYDVIEKLVEEGREESDRIRRELKQATQENDAIKNLLLDEKKRADEVKNVMEQKLSETEEAFAYEKETFNMTLRASKKENEVCISELQRLSKELATAKSQEVKATAELKVSLDKHEKTKLELIKANNEVKNLTTELSQKQDEQMATSTKLSGSIKDTEAATAQLNKLKEELEQKANSLRVSTEMTQTLNLNIDNLKSQISSYKLQIDQLKIQLKKAEDKVSGSENKSNMLKEDVTSLQIELSRVTELLALMKNEKEIIQQRKDSFSKKYKELIIEKEKLALMLTDTEKENRSYKEQLTSALKSLDEMMKYINASREENDNIIQSLESDLNKALEMKQAAENKMKKLVMELKQQSVKIVELDARVQEKASEAALLQDKLKMLQADIEKLNQSRHMEAGERRSDESKLERQREVYKVKLEEEKKLTVARLGAAENENAELKDSLAKLNSEDTQLAGLKEALQQSKKNEIQLRGELAHKKQQIAISESNKKHLEQHIASLEVQIDNLIADYESKLEEKSECQSTLQA